MGRKLLRGPRPTPVRGPNQSHNNICQKSEWHLSLPFTSISITSVNDCLRNFPYSNNGNGKEIASLS